MGCCTGGQSARLQHEEFLAVEPGGVEEGQWDASGFAGPGRRG
jgi:hypothetical protein